MRLSLYEFQTGAETLGGHRVVYDVANDDGFFGEAHVEGHALVWQLDDTPEEAEGASSRGGSSSTRSPSGSCAATGSTSRRAAIAYRHTHPGPGIRYLLHGEIDIQTGGPHGLVRAGRRLVRVGPRPRAREASQHQPTAFVRVLILPAEWAGKRTIRYVDPADEDRPKLQKPTVYLEHRARADVRTRRQAPRRPARRARRRRWPSAFPARATSPCSTRSTTRRSGSSPAATRSAPRTWPTPTASSPAGPGICMVTRGPGRDPRRRWDPHRLPGLDAADPPDRPGRPRDDGARGVPGDRLPPHVRADGEVGGADRQRRPDPRARLARVPRRDLGPARPGRARAARGHARRGVRRAPTPLPYAVTRVHPAPADLERARELLAAAERPLVVVGGAPWSAEAHAALTAWCAAGGAPGRGAAGAARTTSTTRSRALRRAPRRSAPTRGWRSGCATPTSCS